MQSAKLFHKNIRILYPWTFDLVFCVGACGEYSACEMHAPMREPGNYACAQARDEQWVRRHVVRALSVPGSALPPDELANDDP